MVCDWGYFNLITKYSIMQSKTYVIFVEYVVANY